MILSIPHYVIFPTTDRSPLTARPPSWIRRTDSRMDALARTRGFVGHGRSTHTTKCGVPCSSARCPHSCCGTTRFRLNASARVSLYPSCQIAIVLSGSRRDFVPHHVRCLAILSHPYLIPTLLISRYWALLSIVHLPPCPFFPGG
jgi:hypothetical protein